MELHRLQRLAALKDVDALRTAQRAPRPATPVSSVRRSLDPVLNTPSPASFPMPATTVDERVLPLCRSCKRVL